MTQLTYLMAVNESDVITALNKINENCNFPDSCTQSWSDVQKAYEQDIWFFFNVPENGYTSACASFTREQMMDGVVNVTESDGDSSWFPPPPLDEI
jgi:hypothetical protein